eukprot:TRINITY_DN5055_c0_g1_i2.p1 TRINITY_DN5055_c0_g1~~TRINITY_DN5055_c0_g1_i2.p1  ORF type:complete len:144 (+),score=15.27 TRINITY_DN5055_c0_g1_i2:74-505(+)
MPEIRSIERRGHDRVVLNQLWNEFVFVCVFGLTLQGMLGIFVVSKFAYITVLISPCVSCGIFYIFTWPATRVSYGVFFIVAMTIVMSIFDIICITYEYTHSFTLFLFGVDLWNKMTTIQVATTMRDFLIATEPQLPPSPSDFV